jgi:hypothetical protein
VLLLVMMMVGYCAHVHLQQPIDVLMASSLVRHFHLFSTYIYQYQCISFVITNDWPIASLIVSIVYSLGWGQQWWLDDDDDDEAVLPHPLLPATAIVLLDGVEVDFSSLLSTQIAA